MRKRALLVVVLVIASIVFSACSIDLSRLLEEGNNDYDFLNNGVDDVLDTGPVKNGVLNLFSTEPDTLNPILTSNAYVKEYSCFVFESLVRLDGNQKAVPLLAESWEGSDDGLVWTFYLKENIYWHDGIPFSAEDVEFTASVIMNAGVNSPYKTCFENVESFLAQDSRTFKVLLKSPNSFTPELMTFPVIPKHYFLGEDILTTPKNNSPIGTGPYKFAEYRQGEYIRLTCNENWWNKDDGIENGIDLPYIQEVNIKIYGKNQSVMNAFQSQQVDVITLDRTNWTGYSGRSDIILKKYVSNEFEFVAFNLSNKILKEREVRTAIAYAVDREQIISSILPGEAVASDLPVIPDTWLNDTNVVSYERDVEKAKQILSDAGWKESNGIFYKRINGVNTPLSLELMVNDDNEVRLSVAEMIKEQLKEAGIEIEIKKVKWEDELNGVQSGKFDMALIGCTVASIPDISFLYSSAQIGTGLNISGYSNEEVDRYLTLILKEKDPSMKKAYFINMKEIINRDVPCLGLYFYNNMVIYNKRLRGEFNPSIWGKYYDFTRWYIPVE
ncbi:MAG TPA: peptide ABC transporter substrate-binding protein [Hungateiclostridium thermocellum]|uniref:Extracellular solute-binding protein family 5 n=1 Tax=Acetivibrio thermocellus (strain ATCC 27405 / DSM 1237 / JCM 9322 / NBRC 103400 / NCIMB 10682 / NRRL B-4536 / VPI 7372) TaxID=203119 RepID=A3DDW5_ACET2|nr:peptide ABC transporter substrate-binding protein [Acetivibrio thermocellus]ABN52144.1 extracellular solute-binding protein family 5 [Acetivibrio thermocellus ATCC 27405]THJ77326.1 peptide ABC transporter substrate-binding protein [Acetivibrio thermocellus]UWV48258.1 peptide ABC transporter substrate-binding protein [Acetivibrio thermocellus]HBW27308.1 peptide ABC transporter substrate-binding protein [Acetivibrio thermocellus]HOP93168.1 peptide ABC transporter substrate-binding protein [Ac